MRKHDADAVRAFFAQADENGVTNGEKARTRSRVIRRVASTPKNKSYEEVSGTDGAAGGAADDEANSTPGDGASSALDAGAADAGTEGAASGSVADSASTAKTDAATGNTADEATDMPSTAHDASPIGMIEVDGKLVGFGIHILNEDVYPLKSFEIYLRDCDLVGTLDLSGCADVVFVDLYRNRLTAVDVADMPSLRILGLQDNQIEALDPAGLPACQGIDAGMNRLTSIDVSRNPELVELYVNANRLRELDTSRNPKLKYLRCQDNQLTQLDTTSNPLLRHLYATGNPLKRISALAPGGDGQAPLLLTAGEGGTVGLSFNPIYNAQWKETGEWEQSYHAYPAEGFAFEAWLDETGGIASRNQDWEDEYGTSRQLTAQFRKLGGTEASTTVA